MKKTKFILTVKGNNIKDSKIGKLQILLASSLGAGRGRITTELAT
jgi:hypothetical protein